MKAFTLALLTGGLLAAATATAQVTSMPANCGNCGKITKIEKVADGKSGTGGAVAGAVVGGLLGNQVGGGKGKTLATVAGAAGGAVAGKKIAESNEEYRITLKMHDGSTRVVNQEWLRDLKVGQIAVVKDGVAKPYKP